MSDFPNLLEKRNLFNTVSTLEKNGKKDQIYVQDQIKVKSNIYFAYKRDQMISNFSEYYKLVQYLTSYTKKQLGLTMGVSNFIEIFVSPIVCFFKLFR